MGIFDKVEKDAEEAMAQSSRVSVTMSMIAQEASQLGGGLAGHDQAGQDMQAARDLIGRQRGAYDQDQDRNDEARDGNEQAQDGDEQAQDGDEQG